MVEASNGEEALQLVLDAAAAGGSYAIESIRKFSLL